jgi:endogenous inhibitor of DNA gyrase (YacG/DUF329 family)
MSDLTIGRRRAGPAKPDPCPICKKPSELAFVPFCSARCADIDLGRWLTDRYAIPTAEDENEDADGLDPRPDRPV